MLVIRPEQMAALSHYMQRQFTTRMMAAMRQAFPDKLRDISNDDLRALIAEGMAAASRYGITDEADVEGYLWYATAFGPDFGSSPQTAWAAPILQRRDLSGAEKMAQIEEYYLFAFGMHDHG